MSQELYDRERIMIADVARRIRKEAAETDFDHRMFIGDIWKAGKPVHEDAIELSQGRLIYAIGKVLQPRNVYEVGIGPGITCHSLAAACPGMDYYGVDNAPSSYFHHEFDVGAAVQQTVDILKKNCARVQWNPSDSGTLADFVHPAGKIDLIHIDGDHSFEHQRMDIEKAIRSGADWLLVDDCNDTEVVTACFAAWWRMWNKQVWRGGLLPMVYFEDSRTGSFLFHSGMWAYL